MTHAAKISELTDGLFQSVAGDRSQHASYRRMREQAAKSFRNTTHARTNQFNVQSKLDGLVEKFAVLNRDDLSEGLQARLDELQKESRWMPEILSLLLQLSDRPLEKTRIEHFEALTSLPEDEQPVLTWEDLVAERASDEPGLWDDVERGYHSSGDEATVDGEADSVDSTSTKATSLEDDTIALARLHIVQPNANALDGCQPVKDGALPIETSELTLIRETLFMLRGLLTNLYVVDESGSLSVEPRIRLATAARSTTHDLLRRFCEIATTLNALRRWTTKPEAVPYLQSCQAATASLTQEFDNELAIIEKRYVAMKQDQVVSLINVESKVDAFAKHLVRLSQIVTAAECTSSTPFALLDALYDEISVAEMSGDEILFRALAQVFVSGLRTYLRSSAVWIQAGTVDEHATSSMITIANPDCDLGSFWCDRFAQRTLPDGSICAPKALHPFAQRAFAIGKSRAFLKALSGNEEYGDAPINTSHAINAICNQMVQPQLLPFAQMLDEALEAWILETSSDSTSILRQSLLHDHGLLHAMTRLEEVFCSKNGVLQTFADTLFWRMDHQPKTWKHTFLLSELASSVLASRNVSEAEALNVEVDETDSASSIRKAGAVSLQMAFSWPIQNITRSRTSPAHSKTFAFLLQTYRATYLLRSHVLDLKTFSVDSHSTSRAIVDPLSVRQRLLCFVDVMHNHITTTAQVLHGSLKRELEAAADIDAMATVWASHIKDLETALLLAQKFSPIREAITNCLELCERFASLWVKVASSDGETGRDYSGRDYSGRDYSGRDYSSMRNEFDRLLSFIIAGVRSVGRASGSRMLEELAERLEWMAH